MIADARSVLQTYRPTPEHLAELAAFWLHVRPKLAATMTSGTPAELGYAQSISTQRMIETLFAINNTVEPPASDGTAFARLRSLSEPPDLPNLLDQLFGTAGPRRRVLATLQLIDSSLARLPVPFSS